MLNFCPICTNKQIKIINSHIYNEVYCLNCDHQFIDIDSKKQNFFDKLFDKEFLYLNFCFCPYSTITKQINTNKKYIIKKKNDSSVYHIFSMKSLQQMLQNISLPFTLNEDNDFFEIVFHEQS